MGNKTTHHEDLNKMLQYYKLKYHYFKLLGLGFRLLVLREYHSVSCAKSQIVYGNGLTASRDAFSSKWKMRETISIKGSSFMTDDWKYHFI